jgi:hypothetical protein
MRTRNGTADVPAIAYERLEFGLQAHIGTMWTWPEEKRYDYASRVVGYTLNNYVRNHFSDLRELSSSDALANMHVAVDEPDDTPREALEAFLESKGVQVAGGESWDDLAEAAYRILGYVVTLPGDVAA